MMKTTDSYTFQMNKMLLGGLSPSLFLKRHWHRQPLLIRSAIQDWRDLLTPQQLIMLARHELCEARLVVATGSTREVHYGPLPARLFRDLPPTNWTLLVQGVNHALPAARALLKRFSFLPYARLDDLMVSYAAPGGGVGPHFDSYDVFLLQGKGQRSWQVSAQTDLDLLPDSELKILRRFRAEGTCVLNRGDMLYLPPRFAHDGVALDACLTYSIGFRSPDYETLKTQFLGYLDDTIHIDGRYADPEPRPQRHPAELGEHMIREVVDALSRIKWDRTELVIFLGRTLSEPKSHVVLQPPRAITYREFSRRARANGLEVHPALPLLFHGQHAFLNGEVFALKRSERKTIIALADQRRLSARQMRNADGVALRSFYNWYRGGYINTGEWGRM